MSVKQSKIISVDVDISVKKTSVRTLDAVIFSRDVNAPKINFKITKDGNELSDSTSASLLLTASNYYGMLKDGLNIKLNGVVTGGEVTFALPNDILSYEGIVRADLYIYWEDGSNDGTQPILFSVKRSALDSTASTMSVVYVDEFEAEKARVTKAADDAIGTIDTNATIQQFEADKKAVSDAKDSTVAEINARPDELDDVVSTATAEIKARPEELDDNISIALAEIKAQSDSVEQTASVAKNQINADVLAVDNAKNTAIATINATPSKLDEPINAAQNAISQSVNNVSNAETGAIDTINTAISAVDSAKNTANDSFNQSVYDVQNASVSAVSEIEAVKPDMIQQIDDIKSNINTLVGLQQQNAIQKKIQTAWAWSADGTDGFTTVYPNLNFLEDGKFAKPISPKWNVDGTTISKDDITGYFKVIFNGTGSYNRAYYTASLSTIPIGKKYSVYIKAYSLEDSLNIKLGSVNTSQAVTITKNGNIPKIYKVDGLVRGTSDTFGMFGGLTTTVGTLFISEIKVEQGSIATPWMPSASEVTTADYPKYRGIGVLSSTTPTDYFWEQSDTYRDYKWRQLKEAIIALGGTL